MQKNMKFFVFLLIDSIIVALSVYAAYLLRFDFNVEAQYVQAYEYVIGFEIIFTIGFLYYFKVYRKLWRYANVSDLMSVVKAVILANALFFIVHHFGIHYYFRQYIIPRTVFLLIIMISIIGICVSRYMWFIFRDGKPKFQSDQRRALVFGAGATGTLVVKELQNKNTGFYPVVFIDDDKNKRNVEIYGVPVVGGRSDISKVVNEYGIQDIIIALPSYSKSEIASVIEECNKTNCKIKIIPRMTDLINGKVTLNTIRNVSVEDLLGREAVKLNVDEISHYIRGKIV